VTPSTILTGLFLMVAFVLDRWLPDATVPFVGGVLLGYLIGFFLEDRRRRPA
jgi:hypothetical protein